jgi:hypothetical protein
MNIEFGFALQIAGISEISDALADSLFEAGCDDATFGIRNGVLIAEFSRLGQSLDDVISSAIGDLRKGNLTAKVFDPRPSGLGCQESRVRNN